MWSTADTTEALAQARNDRKTLKSVKEAKPEDATQGSVTGTLEALAAVIPTGIAATYTGGVLLIRGVALSVGNDERTAKEAAMAKAGKSASEIKAYLASLPQESEKYFILRVLILVVGLGVVAFLAWQAANTANRKSANKRKFVAAEPVTASIAFLGWSLASPGTPLAAKYNADDVLVLSVVIALIAAFVLAAAGKVVLAKPAKGTS